jgi:ribose transport system ATP-binding protein
MTGRTIEYVFPDRPAEPSRADELLRVEGLSRAGEFADVSLTVHSGEIVGIAGLVGSGRSELLQTIFGARVPDRGEVRVGGQRLRPGSVPAAVRAGLGMAPEERKTQALLLDEPIFRNITLASFTRYANAGFTAGAREREAAERTARRLDLRPPDVRRRVSTLSGGNQQKVVVGRWVVTGGWAGEEGRHGDSDGTRLLLLDEPTRGVDVGARAELYQLVRSLAEQGVGVLLVSSEVPEVLGLADRVLVMREGHIIHEAPASELDEGRVLDLVMAGSLLTEFVPDGEDREAVA